MCLNLLPATSISYPIPLPLPHSPSYTTSSESPHISTTASPSLHHPHSIAPTPSSLLHHPHCITPTASPPLHHPHSITPTPSSLLHHPHCITPTASPPHHHPYSITPTPSPPTLSPPLHHPHSIAPTPSPPLHRPHSIAPTPSPPTLSPPLHHPHTITPTPSPPLHRPHSITPTGQIERRDALRLNVDCIRIHMSRSTPKSASRYAHVDPTTSTSGGAVGPTPSADEGRKGRVRFSLLCEIGAASFTYDMRRLMEILAFPKAWYSRVLVRHLFFGSSYSDLPDG